MVMDFFSVTYMMIKAISWQTKELIGAQYMPIFGLLIKIKFRTIFTTAPPDMT